MWDIFKIDNAKMQANEIYWIYYWTKWRRAYLPCHDVGFGLATQDLQSPQKLKTKLLKFLVNQTHTHTHTCILVFLATCKGGIQSTSINRYNMTERYIIMRSSCLFNHGSTIFQWKRVNKVNICSCIYNSIIYLQRGFQKYKLNCSAQHDSSYW